MPGALVRIDPTTDQVDRVLTFGTVSPAALVTTSDSAWIVDGDPAAKRVVRVPLSALR
jgi:streptogramin lyase